MDILWAVIIVGIIAVVAGIGLSVCSVLFAVKKDEKAEKIRAALPGANCGACGYSGCDAYAEAIASGRTEANLCAPGGSNATKAIGEILGAEIADAVARRAVIACNGGCDKVGTKMKYSGVSTCDAANMLYGGPKNCNYGCIGFGDCESICPFGAIKVENGIASVDREKCTGCGKCVKKCPKNIISLIPVTDMASVLCSNSDKGAATRKICSVGCIGCMKCTKVCESNAVSVVNNLAYVDAESCVGCGKCTEVCPVGCIQMQS